MPTRDRVLSGMRPTGKLHLGNYLGALANWVRLQQDYDCFYFVANWHVLTTDATESGKAPAYTVEMAADWLGAGLDPERSTLFIQSLVPEHAELHLIFSMVTPLGWLERVPTFKEMVEQLGLESPSYGLLGYPLLQSADILVRRVVPVGADQVHISDARGGAALAVARLPGPRPSSGDWKVPGTDGRKMASPTTTPSIWHLRRDHGEDQADGHRRPQRPPIRNPTSGLLSAPDLPPDADREAAAGLRTAPSAASTVRASCSIMLPLAEIREARALRG
jgi:tryptophanyl-tRNA synthetase